MITRKQQVAAALREWKGRGDENQMSPVDMADTIDAIYTSGEVAKSSCPTTVAIDSDQAATERRVA
jgi:hypothetical protein